MSTASTRRWRSRVQQILANPWTTLGGVIGGIASYLTASGFTPPHDGPTWAAFTVGLTMAVIGALAKDAHS